VSTDAAQEAIGADPESLCDARDGPEPGLPLPTLEAGDLSRVETASLGQLLLGEAGALASGSEVLRKLIGRGHGGNPVRGKPMSTEPIAQDAQDPVRPAPAGTTDDASSRASLRALIHRLELAGNYQRAARSRQLRTQQIEILALEQIATLGSLSPGHLADRLGLTSGGVTALTQRLANAGLIARKPHPRDGRMRVLVATPEGLDYVRHHMKPVLEPAEQAVSWLSEPDRAIVGRFLELLVSLKEKGAAATPAPEQDLPEDDYTPALLM
jgi:DNA-binding MarR family transcriptional regulator